MLATCYILYDCVDMQETAAMAVAPEMCQKLIALLEPRDTLSPVQRLAVTVVTRATHALHSLVPEDVSWVCWI